MNMDVQATSPTIVGVITGVSSALIPQDLEVTPSNEEITLTADEGHFIRSVTVKAIPSSDVPSQEETDNGEIDNS